MSRVSFSVIIALTAAVNVAPAAAQDPASDTQGFIYGRVLARGETYEGRLRWDDEEAFWGDVFNGYRDEMPFLRRVPRDDRRRRVPVRVLGITIGSRWEDIGEGRRVAARFGDIAAIEPDRGRRTFLEMKSGSRVEIDGGSNDVGADIVVWDRERGEQTLDWDRIERIQLMPAPADLEVAAFRLRGTVTTRVGDFRGYIQWDAEESLSTDVLDGENREGDVELPMGELAWIARRSSRSVEVATRDGRTYVLDGTNDVDERNRGIFIDDRRFGRVDVSWDTFERVTFDPPGHSGPPYETFEPAELLRGVVHTTRGATHRGQVVYDLDESETWEMLDGDAEGVSYAIPFALVRAIERLDDKRVRVRLAGGETLELEDSADVNAGNAGVLVLPADGGEAIYTPWEDVTRVEFTG